MKYYETTTTFNYSWDQVVQGYWNRYPNPHRLVHRIAGNDWRRLFSNPRNIYRRSINITQHLTASFGCITSQCWRSTTQKISRSMSWRRRRCRHMPTVRLLLFCIIYRLFYNTFQFARAVRGHAGAQRSRWPAVQQAAAVENESGTQVGRTLL